MQSARTDPDIDSPAADRPPIGSHPLAMFPYFRRFPPSILRDIIYAFIWSGTFGVVFMAIAIIAQGRLLTLEMVVFYLVFADCIGFTIHAMFALVGRRVIADDEPALADYRRARLEALWPGLVLLPVARNGIDARATIHAEGPESCVPRHPHAGIDGDRTRDADRWSFRSVALMHTGSGTCDAAVVVTVYV